MFTNSQMVLFLLVLLASFAESLYLAQNILGHGSMKAQIKLEAAFFHIHLHAIALMTQILLTSSSLGDAIASTHVEGDGATTILMQANLIFQGSLDFYLPKCYGVYPKISRI